MYLLLLVINFLDELKTIHSKSLNKSIVCNIFYHTYHNSLENLNQFIDKFTKTFYSVEMICKSCFFLLIGKIDRYDMMYK